MKTAERPEASRALPQTSRAATVEVLEHPGPVEALWRELESRAFHSGYQRFDWAAAWYRAMSPGLGETPMIIVIKDAPGRVTALLPLAARRRAGLKTAHFIGGKHANLNMCLFDPSSPVTPEVMREALMQAGRRHGIALYELLNQPVSFGGFTNPLAALGGRDSPGHVHKLELTADAEAMFMARFSKDARSKLRRKERRLAELGLVECRRARSDTEALQLLEAFFSQKSQWFAAQSLVDAFADPSVQAILRAAVLPASVPGVTMFGIFAGSRIAATYGAALTAERFSGMFSSFDPDPELSRYSPGDLLLSAIIRMMASEGKSVLDLGIGDARYKSHYCDGQDRLVDLVLPVSMAGRFAAPLLTLKRAIKAVIKRQPKLAAAAARLRKFARG